jgi:hypothetical protein
LKARMEMVLKGSERMVVGGHGPPYGYCWIPASAGMTRRRCLSKASLKPAPTRVPKVRAEGRAPLPMVWACPPVSYPPPKNGGQGVE